MRGEAEGCRAVDQQGAVAGVGLSLEIMPPISQPFVSAVSGDLLAHLCQRGSSTHALCLCRTP